MTGERADSSHVRTLAVERSPVGISEWLSVWLEQRPWAVALAALVWAPLVFLGYGTDVDAFSVRSVGALIRDGSYRASRPPGAPVHEAATALLDGIGGSVATGLGSLVMGALVLVLTVRLLRDEGFRHGGVVALIIGLNPIFIIATTSLADFVWALAFVLLGLQAARSSWPGLAGLCWGLAIGTRLSTGVLVAAAIAALLMRSRDRASRQRVAGATVVAALVATACFVPAWLTSEDSRAFLDSQFTFYGWINAAGRSVVKHELLFGVPALVVLLLGIRVVVAAFNRWRTSVLVVFATFGLLGAEAVFLRFPWKLAHLLPVLVCLALLIGTSPKLTARFALILAIAQLVWGVLALRLVVPSTPNRADSARLEPAVVSGPLLNDIGCRADDEDRRTVEGTAAVEYFRSVRAWSCTNSWWSGNDRVSTSQMREQCQHWSEPDTCMEAFFAVFPADARGP